MGACRVYYKGKGHTIVSSGTGILWQYFMNTLFLDPYRRRFRTRPSRTSASRAQSHSVAVTHAVPVLRELGVRVSASRLYNEYRDQVERSHGLPVHRARLCYGHV